ncbi:hypothetical protein [Chondrinema litorale]|uniref:hypothetical protein n=1 Tax=Chondrinema litorale TaxID=2994555 RepID=UPI0025438ED9|nr:hypothetical protein [Chondrinema litorale]UZR98851.1 hypothetical protein OQ292_33200 [Chondrinema litorale]
MNNLILVLLLFCVFPAWSQNKKTDKILEEGKLLFRLEKASWNSTDHFLANFESKQNNVGGYLSYENEDKTITSIFYDSHIHDKIVVRYLFDEVPQQPIKIDSVSSDASPLEQNLILMRTDAQQRVHTDEDSFFSFYENTSLNYIPLINSQVQKVFILTGPQVNGVVLIGNDYQLIYNDRNEFVKKEKIHNSLVRIPTGSKEKTISETFHSHVLSDYFNSTDICTLLLYRDFVEWKTHIVISKKYVSIFDMKKEKIITMKKKAWEKISNMK